MPSSADRPDLLVIGGGAAGLSAARAARRRGASVTMVTASPPGGECTFGGCVPSKTLIAAAARGDDIAEAFAAVHRSVATIAATEDEATLTTEGITVIRGHARFVKGGGVEVETGDAATSGALHPKATVIATGATATVPPIPGLADVPFATPESLFDADATSTPDDPAHARSWAILGAGSTSCELGQALRRLGCEVTVIADVTRVLPREEPAVSAVIDEVLRREGITFHLGTTVTLADQSGGQVRLHLASGEVVAADRLLLAAGRHAVTERLGLEHTPVALGADGEVLVDVTTWAAKGIYAVGDVTQLMPLAHAADDAGRVAAANALAGERWLARRRAATFDPDVPRVVFTDPEVAHVGMTEGQAAGVGGRVAEFPMHALDRAIIEDRTDGFVRLYAGPRRLVGNLAGGKVLGATIVAHRAGELLHEVVLARSVGAFTGRLAQASHAYPTWSVAIRQAAALFFGTYDGRTARPARRDADDA